MIKTGTMKALVIILVVVAGVIACSKGGKGGGTPSGSTDAIAFQVVLDPRSPGFFSLRECGGVLHAGEYNPSTPRVFRLDGSSFGVPAGESVFDMVEYNGGCFLATESTGQLFEGARSVFRAGGDWNNAYSIVSWQGKLVSGFNEYPHNRRSLVVIGDGRNFETHTVDGFHHPHFGVLGSTLYMNGIRVGGSSELWRSGDGVSWDVVASGLGGFPSRMLAAFGSLYFGTEGDGTVWRAGGGVAPFAHVDNAGLFGQLCEHRGGLYAVTGAGWRASGGHASLWAVRQGKSVEVATFGEPEGWTCFSHGGKLYVGTRRDGGGGKLYRSQ